MKVEYLAETSEERMFEIAKSTLWNEMLAEHEYWPEMIKYNFEYFGENWQNRSLIISNKGEPILGAMIFRQDEKLCFFNKPIKVFGKSPVGINEANSAYKVLLAEFKKMLDNKSIKDFHFYSDTYLNSSFTSGKCVEEIAYVDLTQNEEVIKSNVRSRFKSHINWGMKSMTFKVLESKNFDESLFDEFRRFHIRTSGRETRNKKTWDLQASMIINNLGSLVLGFLNEILVGGVLNLYGKKESYYAVGVFDRKLMAEKVPISHSLMFKSILEAKRNNLDKYVLGDVSKSTNDQKLDNIASFKAGFTNTTEQRINNIFRNK